MSILATAGDNVPLIPADPEDRPPLPSDSGPAVVNPAPYSLFLDDARSPGAVTWVRLPAGNWVVARSYADFVRTVEERGLPEFVSFDHDLAEQHPPVFTGITTAPFGGSKTGADCALWLAERCVGTSTPLPGYAIHSMNPIGQALIASILETARKVIARERPGSEEWLAARQIVRDPTPGVGRRYVHRPSGRQVVRRQSMTEHQWKQALLEFGQAADRGELR